MFDHCQRYVHRDCGNCAFSCVNEDYEACDNWVPCRGGHPTTPNPCESYKYFDLWFGDCEGCPHINYDN